MARRKAIDPCMFCGELPCACFAKPKKEATKKVSDKARMQERAKARKRTSAEPAPEAPKEKTPPQPRERVEVDEFRLAVTTLAEAGMLHPTEKENHPYAFPKLTLEERLKVWKEKVHAS